MKIHFKVPHAARRAAEYMPVSDQLDAIVKGFKAMAAAGIVLPNETVKWIEHCDAVKRRIPK
ncbi:hypothetical protein ACODYM_29320 [Burkholderia gladioli]|uniref:hypothetical protein n=1 Tax=Burkholderia gladioli TaxID=28095 RepID=UPI003B513B2D